MDPYLRLHRTIRRFQEHNRFVGSAYESELSLLESRILTDISARDPVTASEISSSLGLSRTVISRAVHVLKSQKLVSIRLDTHDARRQFLRLTTKGHQMHAGLDKRAEEKLLSFCKNLSKGEPEQLEHYLTAFAEALGVAPLPYTRAEHPLRAPIRRVTQGLGLLSNQVFGRKDLSSVEWHILAKLQEQSNSILAKTFVSAFSIPANTVAGIIKRLIDRRWVVRVVDPRDRRQLQLCLSSEGWRFLQEIEMTAIEQLRDALRHFDTKDVECFEALLSAMIGQRTPSLLSPNGVTLTLTRLTTEQQRASARAFCAEHATRLARGLLLDEMFFGSTSSCFGLTHQGELYAVLEIQAPLDTPRIARLVHLTQVQILDGLPMLDTFVDLATRSFKEAAPDVAVQLVHAWKR